MNSKKCFCHGEKKHIAHSWRLWSSTGSESSVDMFSSWGRNFICSRYSAFCFCSSKYFSSEVLRFSDWKAIVTKPVLKRIVWSSSFFNWAVMTLPWVFLDVLSIVYKYTINIRSNSLISFSLRKILGTRYGPKGTRFSLILGTRW